MKPLQVLIALFAFAFLPLNAASLDDLLYTTTNGEVTITDCNEDASGELVIPDTIEGNPVTSIGVRAFEDCTSLTGVTIPDSITNIGGWAFQRCSSLTSVTIPERITSISNSAFRKCSSLTSMTIPDGVTSIGEYAFENCHSLTSITIPDGVTLIEYYAFEDCTSLTSITIPNSVTSIGASAFQECTSLTSIIMPDKFSAHYANIGLNPAQSRPLFNKAVSANDTVSSNTDATAANTTSIITNTTRIEAIEAQLALLADALAAKDAEIANKNERIAQLEDLSQLGIFNLLLEEKDDQIAALELRPTQAAYDTVVTERDARPTLEEIQDARTGSVILTPSEDGTVQLKIEIEESSDLEVWENQGKSVEAGFPLAEGKKFLRFALK